MIAYYNENERFAAQWLRNLIQAKLIPEGIVDDRSIVHVTAGDLAGFDQCHFFAGIGGWARALELAGWDGPVWTGSCPCQPFSTAGEGAEFDDERHLWPAWFRLISQCRPSIVFGEQVASALALSWFDHVAADLEAAGYAVAAADLCAAGAGAPHIRQRLWFVADADAGRWAGERGRGNPKERAAGPGAADPLADALEHRQPARGGDGRCQEGPGGEHGHDLERCRGLGDAQRAGLQGGILPDVPGADRGSEGGFALQSGGGGGDVADRSIGGRGEERPNGRGQLARDRAEGIAAGLGAGGGGGDVADPGGPQRRPGELDGPAQCNGGDAGRQEALDHARARGSFRGFWSGARWIPCRDGKDRPVKPGIFPLAHGVPGRVGQLRAAGNAIVPQVAAEFIRAVMDCRP